MRINRFRLVAMLLIVIALAALIAFFNQWPVENTFLGVDWFQLWEAMSRDPIVWGNTAGFGLLIPPWIVLIMQPIVHLPMRISWGVVAFLTFATLVASVPRLRNRRKYQISVFLLTFSYLALRQVADGNLEFLSIAGLVLCVVGYQKQNLFLLAAGIVLATHKPQEVILLMPVLGLYILLTYSPAQWLRLGLLVAAVIVPSMLWRGSEWLNGMFGSVMRSSVVDISLFARLTRSFGFAPELASLFVAVVIVLSLWASWQTRPTFSHEKAGMLVAASLLISPYSAGNSILCVLAIGIIPLFQKNTRLGLFFIVLTNLGWIVSFLPAVNDMRLLEAISTIWATGLCAMWLALLWWCLRVEGRAIVPAAETLKPQAVS
jgi:hypothetical protein